MKAETMTADCRTCLYMATHDKCDGCLHSPEDWAEYRKTGTMPHNRYLHYQEGNWMARLMEWQLDGRKNLIIGGTGEAEVNAKGDPAKTAKHLHYVAGECGYLAGTLTRQTDGTQTQLISTNMGEFRLVWDAEGLNRIEARTVSYNPDTDEYDTERVGDQWNREKDRELLHAMTGD